MSPPGVTQTRGALKVAAGVEPDVPVEITSSNWLWDELMLNLTVHAKF